MHIRLATRKSPLALAQAHMTAARLKEHFGAACTLLPLVSTGDRRTEWSLEQQGGKGLFTAELEESLLKGEADIAVHSSKDLPGDMPAGLVLAGCLPRADVRDVLVCRAGVDRPIRIATGSPRRRSQLQRLFPDAVFSEIRGNVDTRLKKVAAGDADATVLAAAGLARLGFDGWPGVVFRVLELTESVPAVGQGAIGIQCRAGDVANYAAAFDAPTLRAVRLERALQAALGAGCHTALGAHAAGDTLHLFHPGCGIQRIAVGPADYDAPDAFAARLVGRLRLA